MGVPDIFVNLKGNGLDLVDTHCHIQSIDASAGERHTRELWAKAEELTADTVIASAVEAGVAKMVCVGCDLEDSKLAIEFVQQHPECFASIGIHPHEAQHYAGRQKLMDEFASLARSDPAQRDNEDRKGFARSDPATIAKKVVAVGECGLDYYYEHSPKEAQVEILRFQLDLARKHGLPVIFHVREAFDDFWPIYDEFKVRGVLHSYTDSSENLQRALERGLYIGVNGIATFTKNGAQLSMYQAIPPEHILFETDAPFLTPTPYRGTINEPKYVRNITEFTAKLRDETVEQLAHASSENASALFGI